MEKKTLSHEKAIERAKSNRRYLKFLFAFSIFGLLATLSKYDADISRSIFFFDLATIALGVVLNYFLVRTCRPSFVLILVGIRCLQVGICCLFLPLTSTALITIFSGFFISCFLYLFAFIACKRIHFYLSPIPVPPPCAKRA